MGEEELPQLGKEPLALLFCCLLLQFREGPGWEVRKEARDFDRSIPGQSFLKVQVCLFLSKHPNARRTEPGYLSLLGPYAHTTYRTWPRVTRTHSKKDEVSRRESTESCLACALAVLSLTPLYPLEPLL